MHYRWLISNQHHLPRHLSSVVPGCLRLVRMRRHCRHRSACVESGKRSSLILYLTPVLFHQSLHGATDQKHPPVRMDLTRFTIPAAAGVSTALRWTARHSVCPHSPTCDLHHHHDRYHHDRKRLHLTFLPYSASHQRPRAIITMRSRSPAQAN